ASLAAMNGVPLAGLLLCSDFPPDPRIMELCRGALQGAAAEFHDPRVGREVAAQQQAGQGYAGHRGQAGG
ncbi:hypothetical protein ACV35E_32775, partial [Pseudomonas aeruginosa]